MLDVFFFFLNPAALDAQWKQSIWTAQATVLKKFFLTALQHPTTPPIPQCRVVPPWIEKHLVYSFIIEITTSIQSSDIEIIVYMSAFPQ